jgi:hypothetical protein
VQPSLLSHEVDFFSTAEAEAREKVRLVLVYFWLWNMPDIGLCDVLCEKARQENLKQRAANQTESLAVCKSGW